MLEAQEVPNRNASSGRRRLVEDQCCIDVGLLYKTGKLGPGNCSVISWSKRTGVVGAVRVVAKTDAIELSGYVTTVAALVPVKADTVSIAGCRERREHGRDTCMEAVVTLEAPPVAKGQPVGSA